MDSDEITYFIVWPWNCEPIVVIHTMQIQSKLIVKSIIAVKYWETCLPLWNWDIIMKFIFLVA